MKKLFENWRSFVNEQDESEDTEEKEQRQIKILIFGHSQTSKYRVGGAQKERLVGRGISAKDIKLSVHSGNNDRDLARKIKKIRGTFTHAILHLDGNTSKLGDCKNTLRGAAECKKKEEEGRGGKARYEQQKIAIVEYVRDTLKVPEQNILIFTPPINTNYGDPGTRLFGNMRKLDYIIRGIGHRRAVVFLRQNFPAAKVHDVIYAGGDAFSDALHMLKSAAGEAAAAAEAILEDSN